MEEKRPGQQPEADRAADGPLQANSSRPGGKAKGGLDPTAQDKALVQDADRRGEENARALAARGQGDRGMTGVPDLDREE